MMRKKLDPGTSGDRENSATLIPETNRSLARAVKAPENHPKLHQKGNLYRIFQQRYFSKGFHSLLLSGRV